MDYASKITTKQSGNRDKRSADEDKDSNPTEGFLCPTCFAAFCTADELKYHYETAHSLDVSVPSNVGNCPIICPVCKLVNDNRDEFITHYSIHSTPSGKVELDVLLHEVANLNQDKKILHADIDVQNKLARKYETELITCEEKCKELTVLSEKLQVDLHLLDQEVQDVTSKKKSLEQQIDKLERENIDLKVQIDERPSADDVAVLKQEIVSVQRMMDQIVVKSEEDMATLKDQHETLKLECQNLQVTSDKLTASNASLSSDVKTQRDRITVLEKELKKKDEECNNTQNRLKSAEKNFDSALTELHNKESEIEKLTKDLKLVKAELRQLKLDKSQLFTQIEEGEGAGAAITQLKEENSRVQDQLVLEMENCQSLSLECNQLTSRLEEVIEKNSKLETALSFFKEELKIISEQKDLLHAEVKAVRSYHDSWTEIFTGEFNTLIRQYEFVRTQLDESYEFMETISDQIRGFIQSDVPAEEIILQNEELIQHGSELVRILPLLRETIRKNRCIEQLEEELSDLKKEKTAKEKELSTFKLKLQDTESLLEGKKELDKTVELLEQNVKMLTEMNDVLMEEKNSLCDSLRGTEEALGLKNNTCQELRSMLHEKDITLQNLESALDEKEAELKKFIKESNEALSELESLKDIVVNLKIEHKNKVEEMEQMHESALDEWKMRLDKFSSKFDEAANAHRLLKTRFRQLEEIVEDKDAALEEMANSHRAKTELLQDNLKTVQIDLQAEQCRRKQAEQKVNELCGSTLELEAKLFNSGEERKALLERCLSSEAANEKLQQNNADLRRKLDESVAALQELGRENQTLQVESVKHQGRKWADDAEVDHCTACGKSFSVTVRKHHCRNCGNIFCNECSSKTADVAASKKPVRVCDICYDELSK